MNVRRRARIAGFTLVEALLATAMMGAILAAIATVTAQWLPNWNRAFGGVQSVELLAAGVERIIADISAAEAVTAGANIRQPVFDGSELAVTFLRTAVGPNTRPGLELIRIAETPTARGLAMVRARARFLPIERGGIETQALPADPVILVRPPYRITFSYAGPDRVWRPTWRGEGQLPSAVRVQLRDASSDRLLSVSTATLVHAEMSADCVAAETLNECLNGRGQQQPQAQTSSQAQQPAR
jgi:general secretion pathway protein J